MKYIIRIVVTVTMLMLSGYFIGKAIETILYTSSQEHYEHKLRLPVSKACGYLKTLWVKKTALDSREHIFDCYGKIGMIYTINLDTLEVTEEKLNGQ